MNFLKLYIKKLLPTAVIASLLVLLTPISAFAMASHDVNAWQSGTALPDNRFAAASATYNGYVYELGGYKGGTYYNTVFYSKVGSDNSLGAWQSTTALPAVVDQHKAVAYNGYLYSLGGYSQSGSTVVYNQVYFAPINANGSIGSWTATTALPQNTMTLSSVVYNGYLYQIGGFNGSSTLSSVSYAKINANGTLGSWQTGNSLPAVRELATAEVWNGYVYLMGGWNGSAVQSTVYYAALNSNGSLGSWQTTTALPAGRSQAVSAVSNGYIYQLGGNNGSVLTGISYAPLNSDGTVGTWQTSATTLPNSLYWSTGAVYHSNLYLFGGSTSGAVASTAVNYAQIEGVTTAILPNATDAKSVAISTPSGTDLTCSSATTMSQSYPDSRYSYPLGLVRLCFNTSSTSNQITLTFITNLQPSEVIARNFNSLTHTYSTINGAVVTATTYGGQPALQLTYNIADNGAMDEDSSSGAVIDPVGIAVANAVSAVSGSTPNLVSAPNTGFVSKSPLMPIVSAVIGSLLLLWFFRRVHKTHHDSH